MADEIAGQREALEALEHRPWPLPDGPWLMGQTWWRLLFAHWPVRPDVVRPHVPARLEVDRYHGRAWIGITPFVVRGLRLRGMLPLPWLSAFCELNVRTYVRFDGRPGIWFFSLDAASRAAVEGARRAYRLPYFHARMSAEEGPGDVGYRSTRLCRGGPVEFDARYAARGPEPDGGAGSPARWLAERYRLYTADGRGRIMHADIHHAPWPLQRAEADIARNTMTSPLRIDLDGDPVLHYSERQDALIWPLRPSEPEPRVGPPGRLR